MELNWNIDSKRRAVYAYQSRLSFRTRGTDRCVCLRRFGSFFLSVNIIIWIWIFGDRFQFRVIIVSPFVLYSSYFWTLRTKLINILNSAQTRTQFSVHVCPSNQNDIERSWENTDSGHTERIAKIAWLIAIE